MTLLDPATDIVAVLTGQTLGGQALVSGTNLFSGMQYPLPNLAVRVLNSGGAAPEAYISGTTAAATFHASVQCIINAPPGADGYNLGEALARGVLGYLQQRTPSGYVSLLAQASHPLYAGPDEDGRHLFTLNFEARYTA